MDTQMAGSEAICPEGWVESSFSEFCFKIYNTRQTWENASITCNSTGGALALNLDLLTHGLNSLILDGEYWIGINYENKLLLTQRTLGGMFDYQFKFLLRYLLPKECGCLTYSGVKPAKCEELKGFICEQKQVCPVGTYGSTCSHQCSDHCAGNGNHKRCDSSTGQCDGGCLAGYTGAKCITPCRFNTYGHKCSHRCSLNCRDQDEVICNPKTGDCNFGCNDGFSGPHCDTECLYRTYGENCSQSCSPFCGGHDAACNSTTGECLSGDCSNGYTGAKCEISVSQVPNGFMYNPVVLASMLAVLSLCVGSILMFLGDDDTEEKSQGDSEDGSQIHSGSDTNEEVDIHDPIEPEIDGQDELRSHSSEECYGHDDLIESERHSQDDLGSQISEELDGYDTIAGERRKQKDFESHSPEDWDANDRLEPERQSHEELRGYSSDERHGDEPLEH
ncbi:multiple epidermal growth factor-like domains 10 [Elysia marginata]|uniref:Multiple epidermal growth factor-like domains 10 n=1 Tax=Elysia marginata TaxID=1093978 RepID=A0AAV4IW42_9GAST|nr:multiple epidermal growth factor-like domains 10 [Elysia marginata]